MNRDADDLMTTAGGSPQTDVLIIGAGLAGLFLALSLAPRRCTIVSPSPIGTAASSAWAQGGLAAALDPSDTPEAHARDTMIAGAGLVDETVAQLIACEGAARVTDLLELGVPFDRTPDGALALSLEAAHSRPRVARVAGDLAGRAIMDALTAAAKQTQSISLIETARAVSLLQDDTHRIAGVVLRYSDGKLATHTARETVLCTGGTGGLFKVTTNPQGARGDALAMAFQVGALIADTEFVQFHPTALDVDRDPAPLATEALRGEGSILRNTDGSPFMSRYHKAAELAPRDEVARAIHAERLAGRGAFLDATEAVGAEFPEHFPTVFNACRLAGIDPRNTPMPISTAAHYHMGGIVSDFWGRSSLNGLSVCGECASTGAHGANRLASNSLLEAVVFAHRISLRLRDADLDAPGPSRTHVPADLPYETLQTLRIKMAEQCAVVRTHDGLSSLLNWIETAIETHGQAHALLAAKLMVAPALARKESRGGHFREDFPDEQNPARSFIHRAGGSLHIESTPL